jgi:hypothetical protein
MSSGTIEHTDRLEVAALLSRYFAAVDDKRLDAETVAATFTPDGPWCARTARRWSAGTPS